MAVTITQNDQAAIGADPGAMGLPGNAMLGKASQPGLVVRAAKIVFDASYPTGGEAVSASALGLGSIVAIVAVASTASNEFGDVRSGLSYRWDAANGNLMAYDGDATEVANTTDLSTRGDDTFWVFGYL